MPGAIVQSAYVVDDTGTNATTIAATLNGVTAGNTLVAFAGWSDGTGTKTATASDGTSLPSAAAKVRNTTDVQSSQVFARENVSAGSHTVTITFSATTAYRRIRLLEVSGLVTASAVDQAASNTQTAPGTGTDAVTSGATAATTNANDFVIGFSQDTNEVDPGTGALTAGTGYTISGSNLILAIEAKSVSATGAQTATFTQSVNNNRTTHVVAFKEAAAAVAPATRRRQTGPGISPDYGTMFRAAPRGEGVRVSTSLLSLAGALASSGGLVRQARKPLTGSLSSAGALTRQTLRAIGGALTTAGALVKMTSRAVLGGMASGGVLIKRAQKPFSGTLPSVGVLSAVKTALLSLVGTLTSSGGLVRQARKPMTGSLSSAGALTRRTLRAAVGAIAASGILTKRINRALVGAIASSATLAAVKTALLSLAGSLTPSGALRRTAQKPLSGSLSSVGVLRRATSKLLAGSVASAGALSKQIGRALSGALSLIGAMVGAKLGGASTAAQRVVHIRQLVRTVWLRTRNRNVKL